MDEKIKSTVLKLMAENIKNGIYVVVIGDETGRDILTVDGFLNTSFNCPELGTAWRDYCRDEETDPWGEFNEKYVGADDELDASKFLTPVERVFRRYTINSQTGIFTLVEETKSKIYTDESGAIILENDDEEDN